MFAWYLAGTFRAEVSWVGHRLSIREDGSVVEAAWQMEFIFLYLWQK